MKKFVGFVYHADHNIPSQICVVEACTAEVAAKKAVMQARSMTDGRLTRWSAAVEVLTEGTIRELNTAVYRLSKELREVTSYRNNYKKFALLGADDMCETLKACKELDNDVAALEEHWLMMSEVRNVINAR